MVYLSLETYLRFNSLFCKSNLYLKFDNIWNGFVGKLIWIETDGLNWIKIGNSRFLFNWKKIEM